MDLLNYSLVLSHSKETLTCYRTYARAISSLNVLFQMTTKLLASSLVNVTLYVSAGIYFKKNDSR